MSFEFRTEPVANPANAANHKPPTIAISGISEIIDPGASLEKTPDLQISGISDIRSLGDNKKRSNNLRINENFVIFNLNC